MGIDGGGLSVADALALGSRNNDNDGWGGGNGYWIFFLFFLLAWGNGGWNGFGNNGAAQGALTRGELCQDMNFQSLENSVRGIQQGLCDGFYAMNTGMLNGFAGVDNAICNLGYNVQQGLNTLGVQNMQGNFALQQSINAGTVAGMQNTNAIQTQLAECCCENRTGQMQLANQMQADTCALQNTIQNTTRDIIDVNNCNTRSILDFLVNSRMQDLQTENQNLKLAASQERQNNYLVNTLRPFTGGYGYGSGYGPFNNGCGCNCGCGCGC